MNNSLIGIAGVHYVVSELSRRGLVALPTVKNTAAYDIVALNVEGTKHANIQVKASSKRVNFFPMPAAEKVRAGPRDFYVLVRWIEREKKYEGFLLSGRQARYAVEESCKSQSVRIRRGTRKKEFPCIHVGLGNSKNAESWAAAWLNFQW
ncbi:MAG: hypothetical protein ACREQ3_15715 [Candidatus Binatia bacterium]